MTTLKALVLRAPGINCDRESAQACRLVGFETDLVHVNQLLKDPERLLSYHFLVLPGGFSYGDDLGAGTLLAKKISIGLGEQLQRFINLGRPVLGICNGFQVLVRAGLLPGNTTEKAINTSEESPILPPDPAGLAPQTSEIERATLTENESAQFECRWVSMQVQTSPCIFTQGINRPIEIPVAHGEGQFVSAQDWQKLQANGQIPLVYSSASDSEVSYPANPNGSIGNIAGICNRRGNVLGLMPHPERYMTALQHPLRRGTAEGHGDGWLIFQNAYEYATKLQQEQESTKAALLDENVKEQSEEPQPASTTYASAGVDIAAGEHAVRLMKEAVRASQGEEVLAGIGAFAGVFSAKVLNKMRRPALVASTDGVGTKTLIAEKVGRYDTVGYDIVNHSINDLLVQGARPLFFMDYLAMGKLNAVHAAEIVKGVANACRDAGCALLGGETAEMPDVYHTGAFDLAGTIVGVVEEDEIINGSTINTGDLILGFPSTGLHTNGYSLARRVFANHDLNAIVPELGESLGEALLRPHRCYLHEITQLREYLADRGRYIKGIAHITGGGFEGNIARILPSGKQAVINTTSWSVPPLFQLLARLGNIPREECYRAFNMGIGMIVVLSPKSALEARCTLPELITIGTITDGEGVVLTYEQ